MRKSAKERQLEELESDFQTLLIRCLEECRNGRWGLFGQNASSGASSFLRWENGDHLKEIARQIHALRAEFGVPSPLVERFLHYCSLHGANIQGEPKLAKAFLDEIHRGTLQLKANF